MLAVCRCAGRPVRVRVCVHACVLRGVVLTAFALLSQQHADLPAVTAEQALLLEPGTLIWLKWESPGARSALLLLLTLLVLFGHRDLWPGGWRGLCCRRRWAQRVVVGKHPQTLA